MTVLAAATREAGVVAGLAMCFCLTAGAQGQIGAVVQMARL